MTEIKSRASYEIAAALAALAVITALRIYYLYTQGHDLFFDEAQYAHWAQYPDLGYYSKPPVVAWSIALTQFFCGEGEACTRLSSPLFHFGTGLFVFGIARTLFGAEKGAALSSALIYITLPGVFLSSTLISTDPPLLFFWAGALFFFARAVLSPNGMGDWLACGVFSGMGLESKYSMGVFAIGALGYLLATPYRRYILQKPGFWLAGLVAFLLFLPNILWNAQHGFVSFLHAGDNAAGEGFSLNVGTFLEFFSAQFFVFGPIFFAALIVGTCCKGNTCTPQHQNEPLLLWQIWPMLVVIGAVALMSRAHANWAAPAYVAGSVYVSYYFHKTRRAWLIYVGIALHVLLAAAALYMEKTATMAGFTLSQKTSFAERTIKDPALRVRGGRELGEKIDGYAKTSAPAFILTDDRATHALLSYYSEFPHDRIKRLIDGLPHDHFQLVSPYVPSDDVTGEAWIISRRAKASRFTEEFPDTKHIRRFTVDGGKIYYIYRTHLGAKEAAE